MSRNKVSQEKRRRKNKEVSLESSKEKKSKRGKRPENKLLKEQFNNLRKQLEEYDDDGEGEEEEEETDLDPRSIQAVKHWYQKKLKARKSVTLFIFNRFRY